jgi:hypothetical protein
LIKNQSKGTFFTDAIYKQIVKKYKKSITNLRHPPLMVRGLQNINCKSENEKEAAC